MRIDVKIPYSEDNSLAHAYNTAIRESHTDWVLFLDHDVFLCNPHWYDMCLAAIKWMQKNDPKAACITCVAGGQRHHRARAEGLEILDSIAYHIEQAKIAYKKHGNSLQRIHEYAAGYFLLLDRKVAELIKFTQPTPKNINKVDAEFGDKLLREGYHIYVMNGLYVYHRRGMRFLKKEFQPCVT